MPDLTIPAVFLAGALFAALLILIACWLLGVLAALDVEDRL